MLLVQFNVNLFDYLNLANQYFEHQISIFRSFIFNININTYKFFGHITTYEKDNNSFNKDENVH
jgi:hypothetical protein